MGDDLGQREASRFDIVAALDDLEVWSDGAQVLVRVSVRQVAQAESLADLSGG